MKDFRVNWQMPALPLGPAKGLGQSVTVDMGAVARLIFETGNKCDPFEAGWDHPERHITEADCRQVKGVRGCGQTSVTPCATPAITPAFKVGDRVRAKTGYAAQVERIVSRIDTGSAGQQRIWCSYGECRGQEFWGDEDYWELIAPTNTAEADAEGWKSTNPPRKGWWVVGTKKSDYEGDSRAYWDGARWTLYVGLKDANYSGQMPPPEECERAGLKWLREYVSA